jgi:hypothetical protein
MNQIRPQAYPAGKIRVGAILFSVEASTDDEGKCSTEVREWVVRSIQAKRGTKSRFGCPAPYADTALKYVNLVAKVDYLTWGKRSSKNGDYGWLKSISNLYRRQFMVGDNLPNGIYTTVRASALYEVNRVGQSIEWYRSEIKNESDEVALAELKSELKELEVEHAALRRRLEKLSKKNSELVAGVM